MLQFSVPCLFFKNKWSDYTFYVGEPNTHYNPIEFQALWVKQLGDGIVDKAFTNWLKEVHTIATEHNINRATLDVLLTKAPATVLSDLSLPQQQSAALKNLLKSAPFSSVTITHAFHAAGRTNLLAPYWQKAAQSNNANLVSKARVIKDVTKQLLRASEKRPSAAGGQLLPFLLSIEHKCLSRVIDDLIESQSLWNLTYGLVVTADTDGAFLNQDVLQGFRKFLLKPHGDQVLAIVELRNILERWSMADVSANKSSYDLTKFRDDLIAYFRPQQWTGKGKPSAEQMYNFAYDPLPGVDPKNKPPILHWFAWLLKSAYAGYIDAQTAVGYYFSECKDSKRYLYWTRKAARRGNVQAVINLGSSYQSGRDGVRRNFKMALRYYLRAEKLGSNTLASLIGHCHLQLKEYEKAREWHDKALAIGPDSYSYRNLAYIYENGLGVPSSKETALKYYIKAGELGDKHSQDASQKLSASLSIEALSHT